MIINLTELDKILLGTAGQEIPDGNIAFPSEIYSGSSKLGAAFDPFKIASQRQSGTSKTDTSGAAVSAAGDDVGSIDPVASYATDSAGGTQNLRAYTASGGDKFVLTSRDGKLGWANKGTGLNPLLVVETNHRMIASSALTAFFTFWADADDITADVTLFSINRPGTGASQFIPGFMQTATKDFLPFFRMGNSGMTMIGASGDRRGAIPTTGRWITQLMEVYFDADFTADNRGTGVIRYEIDGVPVTPIKSFVPRITGSGNIYTRMTLGFNYNNTAGGALLPNVLLGRCGVIERRLNWSERAKIYQWLNGTAYVA